MIDETYDRDVPICPYCKSENWTGHYDKPVDLRYEGDYAILSFECKCNDCGEVFNENRCYPHPISRRVSEMKCPYCKSNSVYGENEICEEPFTLFDQTGYVQYWSAVCMDCEKPVVVREVFVFDEDRNRAMTEEEFMAELKTVQDETWDGE